MKATLRHIPSLLLVVILLLSSCGNEGRKVIPRSKLAKIYAEMLLTDQWIHDTPDRRSIADTSLIYEPILEKYGYDRLDYVYTVHAYLDDPERFARIWRETVDILDSRIKELRTVRDLMQSEEDRRKEREKYAVDFKLDSIFPYMYLEPYVHYHDSLAVEMDSLTCDFNFIIMETSDTTYDGLVMNIKIDSLALTDSLQPVDTVAAAAEAVEKKADAVLQISTQEAVKKTKEDKNLPRRQIRRPTYNKDLKSTTDLKSVGELKTIDEIK